MNRPSHTTISGLRDRSMFGGVGLYADDLFFGILASDVLYFKVDDSNRREYEQVPALDVIARRENCMKSCYVGWMIGRGDGAFPHEIKRQKRFAEAWNKIVT